MKAGKIFFLTFILLISNYCMADYLVQDAKITKIGSTNWNKKVFYIVLQGGTGTCANASIHFPEEYAQSIVAYAQMHSMAVMAYIHNKRITVYNYGNRTFENDNVCTGGSSISIYD